MSENEKVFEKEINVVDLAFYCLKKWRLILSTMIVAAAFLGIYQYESVNRNNQSKVKYQEIIGEKDEGVQHIIANPNIEYYQLAIEKNEEVLKRKKDYLSSSVIMQLDANHLQTGILSFYLDCQLDNEQIYSKLLAAYEAYVTDGRLAKRLQLEDDSISESELQYLISFSGQRTNREYENESYLNEYRTIDEKAEKDVNFNLPSYVVVQIEDSALNQYVFQIRIVAPTKEVCQKYMDVIQNSVIEYSEVLQEVAEHKLKPLASSCVEQLDEKIRSYQEQILAQYVTTVGNLIVLQSNLSTVREEEGDTVLVNQTLSLENPVSSAIKYAFIGLLLGAFLIVLLLALHFILDSKLQSIDAFEEKFGMKILGRVDVLAGKSKWFGFIDYCLYRLEAGAYANISLDEQVKITLASVRMAISREKGVKNVMLAGTIAVKDVEELCERLVKHVEEITFSSYQQIVFNAAALEELNDYDAILFFEKRGVSALKLLVRERELAENCGVRILGSVIL